jgi:hypothetical protein
LKKNIESDFYCYSNGTKKAICKECEKTTGSKMELSTCRICDIVIRKTGIKKLEKSKRYEYARFCNVSYDYYRLPLQMRRRK